MHTSQERTLRTGRTNAEELESARRCLASPFTSTAKKKKAVRALRTLDRIVGKFAVQLCAPTPEFAKKQNSLEEYSKAAGSSRDGLSTRSTRSFPNSRKVDISAAFSIWREKTERMMTK